MSMLLAPATAVNEPPANRPLTSLSSTTAIVAVAVFVFLTAVMALSESMIAPLAAIVTTALRALLAELSRLVLIPLALLLVLAMAQSSMPGHRSAQVLLDHHDDRAPHGLTATPTLIPTAPSPGCGADQRSQAARPSRSLKQQPSDGPPRRPGE